MYVDTLSVNGPDPVRMQRAEGSVRIAFRQKAGRTRLETLFQEGCGKARLPRVAQGSAAEAILINTAGGLTGGDSLHSCVTLAKDSAATVTSQACERIYRSTGDRALVHNKLEVAAASHLCWLPQETILFDGGKLSRTLEVDLVGDATLIAVEAVLFGRSAMGETVRSGSLHDRWRIRRDGRLIFADDLRFDGCIHDEAGHAATLGGRTAMATIIHAANEAGHGLDAVRAAIGDDGGASAWNGKLLVRIVCDTGMMLRRRVEAVLQILMDGRPLPKVWQT